MKTKSKKCFIDTNVFIYAAADGGNGRQSLARNRLEQLLETNLGVVSTQVMKEFYSVAIGKLKISREDAQAMTMALNRFEVVSNTPEIVQRAIDLTVRHSLSIWDAMLVAAAVSAECDVFLTEDLQHGSSIAGVRIENPFL